MKTLARALIYVLASILVSGPAFAADPSSFPSNSLDAQSLGRGGTVIALGPGIWSTFGNPATLTPEGFSTLGVDYLDHKDAPDTSWGLSVLDTSSSIRGSLSYYKDPEFGPEFSDFRNQMWGVSFCQTLLPSLYLGESFHLGEYEPDSSPGSVKRLTTVDAGLLFKLGSNVSLGYVAHNLFPDDRDLLQQFNGFGIGLQLPLTIFFAADYEEDPDLDGEVNLRTGVEFNPFKKLIGRLGYQDLANGDTFMTMGISYSEVTGTLDAAIRYNDQTEKTDRLAFGISIRM